MNKKELIGKIKNLPFSYLWDEPYLNKEVVLEAIKQLDEPQKVKVPQFVADYIEFAKKHDWNLRDVFLDVGCDDPFGSDVFNWLYKKRNNIDVLARAWLDSYEVEKEPKYRISMPKARNHKNHAQFLCEKDGKIFWCGEWYPFRTKFTRKQLEEANFGWVFDCEGIEIEEVE